MPFDAAYSPSWSPDSKHIAVVGLKDGRSDLYVFRLKDNVLDPFIENDNFRRAIKDYGQAEFNSYDQRIKEDVKYLLNNLKEKFGYTEQGARQICIYLIDKNLAKKK